MASIQQLLEALNTKAAPVSSSELAKELGATTETTLTQLKRGKEKGNVDGNVKEGWLITDGGRKALETGVHPTMIDEEVTPRQQFEAIGRRIGIKEERIVLATDIVWSGEHNDIKWVWEALGQADIADDLRSVWVNAWRAKLHKAIPPELAAELAGVAATRAAESGTRTKGPDRDYIIVDDEPARVGFGLGDYSLQDAKDILSIRALKSRFAGVAQGGGGQSTATEKVSELLTAMEPYINKGSDVTGLKEMLADKLALQRQEILSHIPQQGPSSPPKSFIEQLTEFVGAMSQMKDAGPMLKSILGIPESSGNPSTGLPVQITGPDGTPLIMDMGKVIDWRKFQNEERRADERHDSLMGLAKTVRENLGDGVAALKAAAGEAKGSAGAKTPPTSQQQVFKCGDCGTDFPLSTELLNDPRFESATCEKCGRKYTKEELLA